MASTLGQLNPLRYRGYVYDSETGLYYLQSRYYDPALRRFLNADAYTSTGQGFTGNNMFAYCGNNPVNCTDSTGTRYVKVSALRFGEIPEPLEPSSEEEMRCDSLLEEFRNYMGDGSHLDNFQCEVSYDGQFDKSPTKLQKIIKVTGDFATKFVDGVPAAVINFAVYVATYDKHSDLPDGVYDQYTVSVSWDQRFYVDEGVVIEHDSYDFVFIWNRKDDPEPSWYLYGVLNNTRTEFLF